MPIMNIWKAFPCKICRSYCLKEFETLAGISSENLVMNTVGSMYVYCLMNLWSHRKRCFASVKLKKKKIGSFKKESYYKMHWKMQDKAKRPSRHFSVICLMICAPLLMQSLVCPILSLNTQRIPRRFQNIS